MHNKKDPAEVGPNEPRCIRWAMHCVTIALGQDSASPPRLFACSPSPNLWRGRGGGCGEKTALSPLGENIIYPVPHRQYVFSIPIILRKFFLYNRKLLSELCRSAHESLRVFFRTTLGKPEGVIGTVMAIQVSERSETPDFWRLRQVASPYPFHNRRWTL